MITRLAAGILVLWVMGFLLFAIALPQPLGDRTTEAVIVPTGAEGRIGRGLEVLRSDLAERMLVTGVDPEVTRNEFAAEYDVSPRLMRCCVTLGQAAADTRGNGREAAQWVAEEDIGSVRLVTSDWHMRRSAFELGRALPDDVVVVRDAVKSEPSFRILLLEYSKLLASYAAGLVGS